VYHVNQVLGAAGASAVTIARRIRNVHADVVFQQLRHETVGRTAGRHGELHHAGAVRVALQGALDGIHLTTQAAYAL
jgi:hypothetical protein